MLRKLQLVNHGLGAGCFVFTLLVSSASGQTQSSAVSGLLEFRQSIQPVLKEFCYDCHGDGANKGKVAFDEFKSDQAVLEDHDLWLKALKNLRAGLKRELTESVSNDLPSLGA
jgi:hypothetical protein